MDDLAPIQDVPIAFSVNGVERTAVVEPRLLLADFIRRDLELTGTHLGCEQGVCGACTVVVDGQTVRSCLMFAAQIDSAEVETIEGLAVDPEDLHPVQQAFWGQPRPSVRILHARHGADGTSATGGEPGPDRG